MFRHYGSLIRKSQTATGDRAATCFNADLLFAEAYRGQALNKLEFNNTTIAQLRYQRSQAIEHAKAGLKVIENEIIANSSMNHGER